MYLKIATYTKGILNRLNIKRSTLIINIILWIISLITILCVFVPFTPGMPTVFDGEKFAMNYGLTQGLSIGKEMIYTFGPYTFLYSMQYYPSIDLMMIIGSLYLALSYWVCFIFLIKNVRSYWVLVFCTFLAGLMYHRDILFFSFPLLIGLLIYKILLPEKVNIIKSKFMPFYLAFLFAPLGLLILIKGNLLFLCVAIAVLCSIFFILNKYKILAVICLLSPVISTVFFWTISGQSVLNLPNYFTNMIYLISGYTEAMASKGNITEVFLYIVASIVLLVTILIQKKLPKISKIFLFCTYFIFLFFSFKAGFIRHDGHAIASGTSILLASLLLPFVLNTKKVFIVILFALISWYSIDSNYIKTSPESFINYIKSTYSLSFSGIKNRIEDINWLKSQFNTTVNSTKKEASFPILKGTTDIYSFNQSYLIASGNTWSPRPVFQSYAAYTPKLAEINKQHLMWNNAPDNIIFRIEPIDGRVPSIEDGVSWPILINNYEPTQILNNFLYLRKKDNPSEIKELPKLSKETHTFGEIVNLPNSSQLIFTQIEIKPTILGIITNILYKTSQLNITLELNNGIQKKYRIISGMAKSGFIISPLIENTDEFGMLYGKNIFLNEKLVKSITITPDNKKSLLWNKNYSISFSKINTVPSLDVLKIYNFDVFKNESLDLKVINAKECIGSIDTINGIAPVPLKLSMSNILKINGWIATSINEMALPESVYIVLTDSQNNHKFLKTKTTARPDVGNYFKNPELNNSGYDAMADISMFEGKYKLELAIKIAGKIEICPQFKIKTIIIK